MHLVVFGIVGLDWQEGASPHMQGHGVGGNAACSQGFEQFGRKVQACRRGGHRAVMLGIDGLVVLLVLRIFGAFGGDIGGQGHNADVADGIVQCRSGQLEL